MHNLNIHPNRKKKLLHNQTSLISSDITIPTEQKGCPKAQTADHIIKEN